MTLQLAPLLDVAMKVQAAIRLHLKLPICFPELLFFSAWIDIAREELSISHEKLVPRSCPKMSITCATSQVPHYEIFPVIQLCRKPQILGLHDETCLNSLLRCCVVSALLLFFSPSGRGCTFRLLLWPFAAPTVLAHLATPLPASLLCFLAWLVRLLHSFEFIWIYLNLCIFFFFFRFFIPCSW